MISLNKGGSIMLKLSALGEGDLKKKKKKALKRPEKKERDAGKSSLEPGRFVPLGGEPHIASAQKVPG